MSLFANNGTFDISRLNDFYDEFLCDQQNATHQAGLTSECTHGSNGGGGDHPHHYVPPADPAAPPLLPSGSPEIPIVLVNNSGAPDSEVYVVVTGLDPTSQKSVYVELDPNAVGSLLEAAAGLLGSTYAKSLSELPTSPGGHVFYLPYIESAIVWFSIGDKLVLASTPITGGFGIAQPSPTSEVDPNYRTIWDIFEINYEEAGPRLFADASAVTQFNLPLYGYLSTAEPEPVSASNCGLYQPRSFILDQAKKEFDSSPLSSIWNNLFVTGTPSYSNSPTTRLLATGKGVGVGPGSPNYFDKDYLDNAAALGYSLIEAMWSGPSSFYRNNPLVMTIPVGSEETYTGIINMDNTITFTSTPSGYVVEFNAPTLPIAAPTDTTTFQILSGGLAPLYSSDTSPGGTDGVQLAKLLGEAMMVGFVPTTTTISNPNVISTKPDFYTNNPNLSFDVNTTGPWYDLYSKALHSLGFIYAYAFDDSDALWPEVTIVAIDSNVRPTDPTDPTYIGITIGLLEEE